MKLIFCPECSDVVKGSYSPRECACGASGILYLDDLRAFYWGKAVPIGFDNSTLLKAIQQQPTTGAGQHFTAFVIPKECATFEKYSDYDKG